MSDVERIRALERLVEEQEADVVLLLQRVATAERERDEAREVAVAFQQAATQLMDDVAVIMPFIEEHVPFVNDREGFGP